MKMRNAFIAKLIVALILISRAALAAPGDIVNLGSLGAPSLPDSHAYGINSAGINSAGVVVGTYDNSSGHDERAFMYNNGTMVDIGALQTGPNIYARATDINDAGTIVGYADRSPDQGRAFTYSNGVMTDLGTLGPPFSFDHSIATVVNSSGVVVGLSSDILNTKTRGFVWNGSMTDLGSLGGTNTFANGINDAGVIVGTSNTATGLTHAFMYSNGQMTDLGDFTASDITNGGTILGWRSSGGGTHVMKYNNGVITDLQSLKSPTNRSTASFIGEFGVIVGASEVTQGSLSHACLWAPNGVPLDLDAWLDAVNPAQGALWTLNSAFGMNASGMITGYGSYNDGATNGFRGFLLDGSTLLPEPGDLMLVIAPWLLARRKRVANWHLRPKSLS
jgi:probable HAF family extracellular repeat protein